MKMIHSKRRTIPLVSGYGGQATDLDYPLRGTPGIPGITYDVRSARGSLVEKYTTLWRWNL